MNSFVNAKKDLLLINEWLYFFMFIAFVEIEWFTPLLFQAPFLILFNKHSAHHHDGA